jgi:glycosidase
MNCFNFSIAQAEGVVAKTARGNSNISNYTNYIVSYTNKVSGRNPDSMPISFLSNHDMDRIAGAFVTDNNMKIAANLYLLSPGSPVIYYGEEVGLRGSRGAEQTDANRRLAMPWGDGDLVRDPVGSTYPAKNQISSTVTEQMKNDGSLWNYYRDLIHIRNTYPAIARGKYTVINSSERNLGGFIIEYEGNECILLHNTGTEELEFDLSILSKHDGAAFSSVLHSIGVSSAKIQNNVLKIGPQTSVIVE